MGHKTKDVQKPLFCSRVMVSPSDEFGRRQSKGELNSSIARQEGSSCKFPSVHWGKMEMKRELKLDSKLELTPTIRLHLCSCKLEYSFTFMFVLLCLTSQARVGEVFPTRLS